MVQSFEDLVKYVDTERTTQRHQDQIRSMAKEAFKDHKIVIEAFEKDENGEEYPTRFYCAKPGTGIYSFRVCFLPLGVILVYGDIGEMMLQRGGEGWLRGSVRPDRVSNYVMEKIRPVPDWKSREFMPGDALKELRKIFYGVPYVDEKGINFVEQAKAEGEAVCDDDWEERPDRELAMKIAEDWLLYCDDGSDGIAWSRACHEHDENYWEGPYCLDHTSTELWCYFALSWFVERRKAEDKQAEKVKEES